MDPDSASLALDPPRKGEELRCADPARLRAIFDAEYDFVWRLLRRLGVEPGAVDDVAQQVFLVLSRKIESVAAGSERAFLFGTAMRVAKDARVAQARRHARGGELPEIADDESHGPDALLDRKRARELLDRVLEGMDFDLRSAFVLYELERLTVREIADMMGIPQGTAASRLRRAREEFERRVAAALDASRGRKA